MSESLKLRFLERRGLLPFLGLDLDRDEATVIAADDVGKPSLEMTVGSDVDPAPAQSAELDEDQPLKVALTWHRFRRRDLCRGS